MEGDSWFRLPDFPFKFATVGGSDYDIERGMRALGYNTRNNAHWGDTIETMAGAAALPSGYLNVLTGWTPHIFMLSGGGNDLLGSKEGGPGRLLEFLVQHRSGEPMTAADYLNTNAFDAVVRRIVGFYRLIVEDVLGRADTRRVRILIHGYDYVRPRGLAWIQEPFDFRNVPANLRDDVIRLAINRYNRALAAVARAYPGKVYHVNLCGIVKEAWHDELHPTRAGFDAVCAKFDAVIQRIL
jgi:hypothetical protein